MYIIYKVVYLELLAETGVDNVFIYQLKSLFLFPSAMIAIKMINGNETLHKDACRTIKGRKRMLENKTSSARQFPTNTRPIPTLILKEIVNKDSFMVQIVPNPAVYIAAFTESTTHC